MPDSDPLNTGYRWATVTPDDRSGILYIVAFLSFTYSGLTFITRCFIKWNVLGLDDAAICVAQIASLVQFALLVISLSAGLGKNFDLLNENDYANMASSQFGNQIALYIALGLSKVSTILLIQRLFTRDMKKAWIICNLVMAMVVIWTIVAAFLVSVGCSPEGIAPRIPSQMCPTIVARYKFVVVLDAITDIVLVVIPGYLCWQLQMSVTLKLQVLAVFAFRLPPVALAGLFLKTWINSLHAENPGIRRTPAIVFQQMELCVGLMAATIPCLKSFIRSFDTGSGVKATIGSSNEYGSYGRTGSNTRNHGESYELPSLNRSKAETSRNGSRSPLKDDDGVVRANTRPFTSGWSKPSLMRNKSLRGTSEPRLAQDADRQSQESGKELFIRREMQWEVTSEEARRGSDVNNPGILRLPQ